MQRGCLFGLISAGLAAIMLAGCGLLPEEERAPTPPIIRSYEKTEYKLAATERGDIVKREKATFKYAPALKESLAFPVDGSMLAGVYVTVGETVEKGTLLAELDDDGLVELADAQRERIAELEASVETLERDLALELRALDVRISADPENAQLKASRESTSERYKADIDASKLRLSAARSKLGELEDGIASRKLYAPFDGTVTFIKSFGAESYRSTAGEVFITISDKTMLTFTAEGETAAALFEVGDEVEIAVGDETYPAEIVAKTEQSVTLEPDEHIPGVGEGSYGNVSVVTGAVYDVLRVPSNAIKSANGQSIVYILSDGVRTLREVETGFSADGYTEIVSGLSEGEQVIAQ